MTSWEDLVDTCYMPLKKRKTKTMANGKNQLPKFVTHSACRAGFDTIEDAEFSAKIDTADQNREIGVYQLVEKTVPVVPQIEMVKVN